ncbi:MAG TPA: hypothetical protein VGF65_14570 [Mycobacterium sp.]|jgi:multidrug efflux pump subunit AcrA (membrane-fusion protein)
MGNELALDVNVICLLILGLFCVCIVTALAGPVVAGVSYVGLWLYRKGSAEMRRAQAEALEAEAAAAVAAAAVSAAEAEIAQAQVRLLREHPELFGP